MSIYFEVYEKMNRTSAKLTREKTCASANRNHSLFTMYCIMFIFIVHYFI